MANIRRVYDIVRFTADSAVDQGGPMEPVGLAGAPSSGDASDEARLPGAGPNGGSRALDRLGERTRRASPLLIRHPHLESLPAPLMWVSVEATLLAAGDRLSGCEIDGAQARGGVRVRDIAEAFAKGDEGILGGTFERLIVTALNDPSAVGYLPAAALRDCVSSGMDLLLEEFHRRCRTDTSQARRSTAEVEPLKTAYLHAVDIAAEKRDRRAPGRLTQLLNELPTTAVVLDVFGDGWPVDHLLAREVNLPDSLRHFQSADLLIGAPPFVPLDRGSTEGPLRVYFPATVHLAAKRARPTHHAGLPGLQLEIRTSRGWKTRPSADAVLDPIASRIRRRFRAVLEETHPGHDIVIDHLSPLSRAIRASFAAVGCALLGGANEGLLVDFRPARRLLQDAGRPIDDLLTEIRFLAGTSRAG